MSFIAITEEQLHSMFAIETDDTGEFWVADKSGPNVILSDRFKTKREAQNEWSRLVERWFKN